jgi:exodeoxyribonuclease VII large subunit
MSDLFLENSLLDPTQKVAELNKRISWITTHRKARQAPDLLKLKTHKSVAVRRKVATSLAIIGDLDMLTELKSWQEEESDRQTWLILENTIDKLVRRSEQAEDLDKRVLSVSEASIYLKNLVREKQFWIQGELSDIKLYKSDIRQNFYFLALKDSKEISINCFFLASVAQKAGFAINEGLSVKAFGRFSLNKNSNIRFEIQTLKLTGEGELLRNLQKLKQDLEAEGLFDISRKRPIPSLPEAILLVASPNSAAIKDFQTIIQRRRPDLKIYFLAIKTQGVSAEFEILAKLEKINSICKQNKIDTVVLTRGGGSKDDLFVFNSEKVVRAIYSINRPTIVAIGHERDHSLAEMVADLRSATPSESAEKASLSKSEILAMVNYNILETVNLVRTKRQKYQEYTHLVLRAIKSDIQKKLQDISQKSSFKNSKQILRNKVYNLKLQTQDLVTKIEQCIRQKIYKIKLLINFTAKEKAKLSFKVEVLANNSQKCLQESIFLVKRQIQVIKQDSYSNLAKIKLSDPHLVLDKGYALIWQNQRIVDSKNRLELEKKIKIQFKDGKVKL